MGGGGQWVEAVMRWRRSGGGGGQGMETVRGWRRSGDGGGQGVEAVSGWRRSVGGGGQEVEAVRGWRRSVGWRRSGGGVFTVLPHLFRIAERYPYNLIKIQYVYFILRQFYLSPFKKSSSPFMCSAEYYIRKQQNNF